MKHRFLSYLFITAAALSLAGCSSANQTAASAPSPASSSAAPSDSSAKPEASDPSVTAAEVISQTADNSSETDSGASSSDQEDYTVYFYPYEQAYDYQFHLPDGDVTKLPGTDYPELFIQAVTYSDDVTLTLEKGGWNDDYTQFQPESIVFSEPMQAGKAYGFPGSLAETIPYYRIRTEKNGRIMYWTLTMNGYMNEYEITLDTRHIPQEEEYRMYNFSEAPISGNASHFVKIGDRVYFREYGPDAFENPVVWGDYLSYPRYDSSMICYYDEVTGETNPAFTDFGYGKIAYMDGAFFLNYRENDAPQPCIYALDPAGVPVELAETHQDEILDCYDDRILITCGYTSENGQYHSYIKGINSIGQELFRVSSEHTLEYLSCGNGLILAENDYNTHSYTIYRYPLPAASSDIDPNAALIPIAQMSYPDHVYASAVWYERQSGSTADNEFIGIEYREGSGAFYAGGKIIEIHPNLNGDPADASYDLLDPYGTSKTSGMSEETEESGLPFIEFDDKNEFYFVPKKSGTFYTEDRNLYCAASDGQGILLAENMLGFYRGGSEDRLILAESPSPNQNQELFAMIAEEIPDERGNIGWRDGYRALTMRYYRITQTEGEEPQILSRVNHNVILE